MNDERETGDATLNALAAIAGKGQSDSVMAMVVVVWTVCEELIAQGALDRGRLAVAIQARADDIQGEDLAPARRALTLMRETLDRHG